VNTAPDTDYAHQSILKCQIRVKADGNVMKNRSRKLSLVTATASYLEKSAVYENSTRLGKKLWRQKLAENSEF